jgi:hypothetical protein
VAESELDGVTISFDCPNCGERVQMVNSEMHNLVNNGDNHSPRSVWDSDYDCPVHFSDDERVIRNNYHFIRYRMPPIFTRVPANVTDQDVLRSVVDSVVTHQLGVTIEVSKQDDDGNTVDTGYAHGWYHGNKPSYCGVLRNLDSPQNVIVTESRSEFAEFLERWFYYNREYNKPETEYIDSEPDPENSSLEEF